MTTCIHSQPAERGTQEPTSSGCGSVVEPEPAAAVEVGHVAGARCAAATAEIAADDRRAEVVELRCDHATLDPVSHLLDEAGQAGVVAEPEERRLGAEPGGVVELTDGPRDRERVRRVGEPHLTVGLEVAG